MTQTNTVTAITLSNEFKGAKNTVAVSNPKMKMTGARLMTRKEYRDTFSLGRSDAEKQHNEYLRVNGIVANKAIAGRIAGGEILVTGIKEYASGKGTLSFMLASAVVDKAPAAAKSPAMAKLEALGLTDAQLEALLATVSPAGK